MVPLPVPVAEVCAVAKRDLAPQQRFDAIGETCYRSWTMTVGEARAAGAVPVGLLEGGKVLKAVRKGELLTTHNAAPDASTNLFRLRRLQEEMLAAAVRQVPRRVAAFNDFLQPGMDDAVSFAMRRCLSVRRHEMAGGIPDVRRSAQFAVPIRHRLTARDRVSASRTLNSWRGICALLVAMMHFPASGFLAESPVVRGGYLFVDLFFSRCRAR